LDEVRAGVKFEVGVKEERERERRALQGK